MTHLSDFSYLDRGFCFVILWGCVVAHMYRVQGWKAFDYRRLLNRDPRAVVTLLLFVSMSFEIAYDILGTYIKYTMGFVVRSSDGKIITTPKTLYPDWLVKVLIATDFCANVGWSTKSCALFLINLTWHHVSQSRLGGSLFSSREIIVYKVISAISLVTYPALQFILIPGTLQSTLGPQFVTNFENVVLSIIFVIMARRFDAQAKTTNSQNTKNLLAHFRRNNLQLVVWLICDSFGLFVINVDLLTPLKPVTNDKFLLDLFTKFYSTGIVMTFWTSFQLIYPDDMLTQNPTIAGSNMKSNQPPSYHLNSNGNHHQILATGSNHSHSNPGNGNNSNPGQPYPAVAPYPPSEPNTV